MHWLCMEDLTLYSDWWHRYRWRKRKVWKEVFIQSRADKACSILWKALMYFFYEWLLVLFILLRKCFWLIWKVNQAKISLSDIWKSYATYKKKVNYVCAVTVCWKIGLCIVFRIIFWCYKFPLHSGMTFSSAFNLPFTTNHI